jgi:hypothetical protein
MNIAVLIAIGIIAAWFTANAAAFLLLLWQSRRVER